MNEKINLLFHKKSIEVLLCLYGSKNNYIYGVAKKVNTTYCHLHNLIKRFIKLDLLITNKVGRKRIINLSPKGILICENLSNISEVL